MSDYNAGPGWSGGRYTDAEEKWLADAYEAGVEFAASYSSLKAAGYKSFALALKGEYPRVVEEVRQTLRCSLKRAVDWVLDAFQEGAEEAWEGEWYEYDDDDGDGNDNDED